jgi:hypothetical protein
MPNLDGAAAELTVQPLYHLTLTAGITGYVQKNHVYNVFFCSKVVFLC